MSVGVMIENARLARSAILLARVGSRLPQVGHDIIAAGGNQHFAVWLEKEVYAFPFIGNQASARAGCFKNAGRR